MVLYVSLRFAPGAEGLVESDCLFEETRSVDAGECFP